MQAIERVLHIFSIILSLISAVFFIVGCAGYAAKKSTIEHAPWIIIEDGGYDMYFGLYKVFFSSGGTDGSVQYSHNCNSDWCNTCDKNGKGAVGLVFLALLFSIIVIAHTVYLLYAPSVGKQIANVFLSFAAACTSLIAVGLFMGDCYYAIKESNANTFPTKEMEWGPGASVTILGMFFMWIVSFMQISLSAMEKGPEPSAAQQSTAMVGAVKSA